MVHNALTKYKHLVVLLAFACVVDVCADEAAGIYIENPAHDFGDLSTTGYHEHTFVVRNDTDEDAKVVSEKSTCGCTVITLSSDTIPAHGSLEVPLRLKGAGQTGSFEGKVFIQLDAFDEPLEIQLAANFPKLERDLYVFPRKVVFTDAVVARKDTEVFLVKRKDDSPVGSVTVTSDSPMVKVLAVDELTSSDGVQFAAVRIRAVNGEPGTTFSAVITVQGSHGEADKASCPIEGNFVGVNQTYPGGFLLNLIGRDSVYQPLEVLNALGNPITVKAVRLEPSDMPGAVTFRPVDDSKWELTYKVNAVDVTKDTIEGHAIVEIEDASELTLPVYIMK